MASEGEPEFITLVTKVRINIHINGIGRDKDERVIKWEVRREKEIGEGGRRGGRERYGERGDRDREEVKGGRGKDIEEGRETD